MVDSLTPSPRERESSWAEAFAALPVEAPPRDVWRRLERKLDAAAPARLSARRERRLDWTIGLASAAVLAVVAWSPLLRWTQAPGQPGTQETSPSIATTARPQGNEPGASEPGTTAAASGPRATPVAPTEQASSASAVRAPAEARRAAPDTRVAAAASAPASALGEASRIDAHPSPTPDHDTSLVRTAVATATEEAPASGPDARIADTTPDPDASPDATVPSGDASVLRALQAQSAQLEALVALARDDSAGSASLALAGSELDASIAAIDASLTEPDLSSEQRTALWQQRIDALQQLARLESTERWLASQGALYDTALVSVD